jgi:hypothetical protein
MCVFWGFLRTYSLARPPVCGCIHERGSYMMDGTGAERVFDICGRYDSTFLYCLRSRPPIARVLCTLQSHCIQRRETSRFLTLTIVEILDLAPLPREQKCSTSAVTTRLDIRVLILFTSTGQDQRLPIPL